MIKKLQVRYGDGMSHNYNLKKEKREKIKRIKLLN